MGKAGRQEDRAALSVPKDEGDGGLVREERPLGGREQVLVIRSICESLLHSSGSGLGLGGLSGVKLQV